MNRRDAETQRNKEKLADSERAFFIPLRFCVSAVTILHFAVALPLAYFLNIWADEASTLYTTENGLFEAFYRAFTDEKQAPLYFWLLSLWREMNHSIFFARVFSVIFSLLAIKFFYDLVRKFFDEKAPFLTTVFFALHPYLIWTSLEIRVYSLVVLLSVLLLKFWTDGFFHAEAQSSQSKAQIFYVLTAVAALYTNYYLGFLLVGCFVALVVLRKWRAARVYFWQMLLVGIAILPLLWMIKMQFAASAGGFQGEKSLAEGLRLLWNYFLTFALPTEIFPLENITTISFLRVWLMRFAILAAVILLIKKRRFEDAQVLAFGAIFATVSAFLLLAYYLLGEIYVSIRHAAVLFAPTILLAAVCLKEIFPQRREDAEKQMINRILPVAAAIFVMAFFAYSLFTLYPNAAKRGDWARVAEYIKANETPNQPVVVFTAFDALALPYHYTGANKILPDERFFDFDIEADAESADAWRRQTDFIISEIPVEAQEIWLLTNDKCASGAACEPLENFVRTNYTIIEEKDFYKEKVRLLRKKQK